MQLVTRLIHALPLSERRVLNRKEAASYVGVSAGHFDKLVASGKLPEALPFNGVRRWDKEAIDRRLNSHSQLEPSSSKTAAASAYDEWSAAIGQG